ncbi:MAG: lytic transglycosylase domain-containing protein [bacterium]
MIENVPSINYSYFSERRAAVGTQLYDSMQNVRTALNRVRELRDSFSRIVDSLRYPPSDFESALRREIEKVDAAEKAQARGAEAASVDVEQKPEEPEWQEVSTYTPRTLGITDYINIYSQKYNIPPRLVDAIIRAESGYNPYAKSPRGALGLMQLMPDTADEMGVEDPFDVEQNIEGGTRYLRRMIDRFNGNLHKALAAYNAGPENVDKYGGIPPFQETRDYVRRVLRFFEEGGAK